MFVTEDGEIWDGSYEMLSDQDVQLIEATAQAISDANRSQETNEAMSSFFELYDFENEKLGRCLGKMTFQDGLDYVLGQGYWANHSACAQA